MENNILGPEGRLKEDLSPVDQICCSEQEMESRMLPLKQECVKDSPINDEETRNNREDEMETRILPPQNRNVQRIAILMMVKHERL